MLLWVGILKRRWNNVFKRRTKSENNNKQKGRKWKIFEMAGWTTAVAIAKLNCALAVLKRDAQCIGWCPFLCYLPEDTFEYVKLPCWKKTLTVDMWSVWLHKFPDVLCLCHEKGCSEPSPKWLLSHYCGYHLIPDETTGVYDRSQSSLIHCWGLPDRCAGPILSEETARPILVNRSSLTVRKCISTDWLYLLMKEDAFTCELA